MLAADAMTDLNPDAHRISMQHIFPRLGETATTNELVGKLQHKR